MILRIKSAKEKKLKLGGWLLFSLAFFFIFFGMFIYLEIIELNFCNLSKNTKIKIAERAKETPIRKTFSEKFTEIEDLLEEEEREDGEGEQGKVVEFFPGYLVEF